MIARRLRVRAGGGAALLLLPGLLAVPTHAQGASGAACLITVPLRFTPGLTLIPHSGFETSGGERGTISCAARSTATPSLARGPSDSKGVSPKAGVVGQALAPRPKN